MRSYSCLCGTIKAIRHKDRIPADCEVCSLCGTTLYAEGETPKKPKKHSYMNGICIYCHTPKPITNKLSSKEIKTSLFHYFRFKRQCICASEVHVPHGIADMLIQMNNGAAMEVEVKVSSSDFNNEVTKKKEKHDLYKGEAKRKYPGYMNRVPNYFYFCAPTSLMKKALATVQTINPKYGIIEYTNQHVWWQDRVVIRRRAKSLNKNMNDITYFLAKRLNNEVCSTRRTIHEMEAEKEED